MATFYMATPYPGTELWDIYIKEGLISPDFNMDEWMATPNASAFDTKYLKGKEIQKLRDEATSRFYTSRRSKFLNPLRTLRKVYSMDSLKYMLKLVGVSGTVMKELKREEIDVD